MSSGEGGQGLKFRMELTRSRVKVGEIDSFTKVEGATLPGWAAEWKVLKQSAESILRYYKAEFEATNEDPKKRFEGVDFFINARRETHEKDGISERNVIGDHGPEPAPKKEKALEERPKKVEDGRTRKQKLVGMGTSLVPKRLRRAQSAPAAKVVEQPEQEVEPGIVSADGPVINGVNQKSEVAIAHIGPSGEIKLFRAPFVDDKALLLIARPVQP